MVVKFNFLFSGDKVGGLREGVWLFGDEGVHGDSGRKKVVGGV